MVKIQRKLNIEDESVKRGGKWRERGLKYFWRAENADLIDFLNNSYQSNQPTLFYRPLLSETSHLTWSANRTLLQRFRRDSFPQT